MNDHVAAIIVAAGNSTRYGSVKVLDELAGTPALARTLAAFVQCDEIGQIVVVTRADLQDPVRTLIADLVSAIPIDLVTGGERRQDSVAAGLRAVPDAAIVVVHDGARPMVAPAVISATIAAVRDGAAASLAAVPVSDTLKHWDGTSVRTVDRTDLWRAQTPQAFRADMLRSQLDEADRNGRTVTDEISLVEHSGGRIALVQGDERNLKLTTPGDRPILEALAQAQENRRVTRTGIGYDVHRLVTGRELILGGVSIPHEQGLDGHSDADSLLHAIMDAILGACALGDIGALFPPTDEAFRGASSLGLLEEVVALAGQAGFSIIHLDGMVIAEAPRIGPFVAEMRARIAGAAKLVIDSVSVKATTNEGMGFAGRREGIAALATATVLGPG